MDPRAAIFKSYDVRGVVGEGLDAAVAEALGRACAAELGGPAMVVGRDARPSGEQLAAAFMAGVRAAGVDTIDVGCCPTEVVWHASAVLGAPGAMWTASHNPPEYNGLKLCRANAEPVALDRGLAEIRDRVLRGDLPDAERPGRAERRDLLDDYAAHVRGLVDAPALAPRTVVVDAGNGMAGVAVPAVVAGLPMTVLPLHFALDGTFPNHLADPLDPANLADVQQAVEQRGADLGMAFDGDADRMVCVDERGAPVSPSVTGAILVAHLLPRHPGAVVLHSAICSRVVAETITAAGGVPVRTRAGHSHVKAAMAETGAVLGVEHSGHYYFRDFHRADSGLAAALLLLEALSDHGGRLSELADPYRRYPASGEINRRVADPAGVIERVAAAMVGTADLDRLDGLTATTERWWFNLRASHTEPLLRLNVEAADRATVEEVRDRVLALVER